MSSDGRSMGNSLSWTTYEIMNKSRVFVVGAGGIGCELIKNLVLTGFKNIEIIDLDTIDVSNLNRQFLFQRKHVGKSKARIAHESAITLRPNINVVSHHSSVFSPEFNMPYFKRFHLVLNALDNNAARNHVNRLCLAANVPLVESGSAGYLGQVNVIRRGKTECYECSPKPRRKTFPGCTIRNTPSELIHCVVWAKNLFNQLFGEEDADQDVSPDTADPGASSVDSDIVLERVSTRLWAKDNDYAAEKVFNKLFHTDIEYLLSMEKLWAKRQPPAPVKWFYGEYTGKYPTASQRALSFEENVAIFGKSIADLKEEFESSGQDGVLIWDKDNDSAMAFVAAAANIRAKIFDIAQKSYFEIKSMAGNIIPAIATTNAVVAGLIVVQAIYILEEDFSRCKNVFVSRFANPAKKLLAPCTLDMPRPSCYVCAERPEVIIKLDVGKRTLNDLKEKILKSHLGMLAPDVEIDGAGTILLSSEEGESDDNLPKTLSEFNIRHGARLRADDFLQNLTIILNIEQNSELQGEKTFVVVSGNEIADPNSVEEPSHTSSNKVIQDADRVVTKICVASDGEESNEPNDNEFVESRKRKIESNDGDFNSVERASKQPKVCSVNSKDDDVHVID